MPRRTWTLLLVCTATFMLLLDVSVVISALPTIRTDLGASFADIQWVVDAYTLALAAVLLPAASLADLRGRRRVFLLGLAVFTAASAGCAAATGPVVLDVARAVQGLGGALLFATALPLLAHEYRGAARAGAVGVWSAVLAASVAIGPVVGGALVDGLGWRWIFLVNLPVGVAALVAGRSRLAESRDPSGRRIDVPGLVLLTIGLLGLVYGTVRGNADGWTSVPVLAAYTAAVVGLAGFVAVQLRSTTPMVDLRLFRSGTFTAVALLAFLVSAGLIGSFVYQVIYIQSGLGYSPLSAGVRFLLVSGTSFLGALVTGRLLVRLVPLKVLLVGSMAVTAVGVALTARIDGGTGWGAMVPGFLLTGVAWGVSTPALAAASLAAVPAERAGMATGLVNTARQVGTAVGVAALGALFQAGVTHRFGELLAGTPLAGSGRLPDAASAVAAGGTAQVLDGTPPALRSAVAGAARTALAESLSTLLLVVAGTLVLATLAAAVLVRGKRTADGSTSARNRGGRPVTEPAPPEPPPAQRADVEPASATG